MTITKVTIQPKKVYDHGPLSRAAIAEPHQWFTDDDEAFPRLNGVQVKEGALLDYRPAGAFEVRGESARGPQMVRFLGVPTTPWVRRKGEAYASVERTLDERECPEGTPEHVLHALRKRRERSEEAERKERKRAKKAAKKRAAKVAAATLPDHLRE